jgi:hypothetical protein
MREAGLGPTPGQVDNRKGVASGDEYASDRVQTTINWAMNTSKEKIKGMQNKHKEGVLGY